MVGVGEPLSMKLLEVRSEIGKSLRVEELRHVVSHDVRAVPPAKRQKCTLRIT